MVGETADPEGEFSRGFGNGGACGRLKAAGVRVMTISRPAEFCGGWNFAERLNSAEMDPVRREVAGKPEVLWGCKFGRESVKSE